VNPPALYVSRFPTPSSDRCWHLGAVIANAVASFTEDIKVQGLGTGVLSHDLRGPRAALINS
jgi:hypothetical protein